ncbi:fluoride efflux transporter CrcB [Providencia stuartii]|uniref:fluoride efflux transporter CrcB n=1 Tax=Providencia TaxID=586 RepID=UPI0013A734F0|nr:MULTISPECIES: fluoride efflux transporter CrcB [Providencia]ELR5120281.1 fluoride efflux transporter CrcB [Providencia stuartii]ELR5123334.1 fluoride efflux transporter CrcB [Providencia stuartii]ELR5143432.1 fluoride efflux transporter CrcB [Providencia stuartii]QIC16386.1 fluoride efflux transporter CrcB [Providencia vermicola]WBA55686.1 fluoride efflux transporter CrcB [Providencia sp. 21OH12SH02B-Prov]
MYASLFSIALGSVLGGWLRWFVSLRLNHLYPNIPMGTVFVNLVGGFVIGFAIAYFASSNLNPAYKLFIVTGFCGAFTTFSTFSWEVLMRIQEGKLMIALSTIAIHVVGALFFTFLGMLCHHWLLQQ